MSKRRNSRRREIKRLARIDTANARHGPHGQTFQMQAANDYIPLDDLPPKIRESVKALAMIHKAHRADEDHALECVYRDFVWTARELGTWASIYAAAKMGAKS